MAKPFTIYKLTILYLLDKARIPLTNTQISSFFLEQGYTDYFHVQEALSELQDFNLLIPRQDHRNTQYLLSPNGRATLRSAADKLTDGIREDVRTFLERNRIAYKEENATTSFYYRTPGLRYAANCRLFTDDSPILELTITVDTKSQAEAVCRNWEEEGWKVYGTLLDLLVR